MALSVGPIPDRLGSLVGETKLRRVGGRGGRDAAFGVSLGETASSEDLGGSSKYSNENFED